MFVAPDNSQTPNPDTRSHLDELSAVLYDELRGLAAYHLRNERPGHTLQPTALVHEAYLKLSGMSTVQCTSKAHLMALASQAIRRILVDHARGRSRLKRGGVHARVGLHESLALSPVTPEVDLLDLEDSLNDLEQLHARQARIVELRFFGGLSIDEVSGVLGISPRAVDKDWAMARAWLSARMSSS